MSRGKKMEKIKRKKSRRNGSGKRRGKEYERRWMRKR